MDVVQHCLHPIGLLLLLIVVRSQLGTFVESLFALEETSDSSARKKNRLVISALVRPQSGDNGTGLDTDREVLCYSRPMKSDFSVLKLLKSFNIQITIGQKLF